MYTQIILVFFISLCLGTGLELPPGGFWFNCGLDFCEFPKQHCLVREGQKPKCEACTLEVCYLVDTPSQCYTKCRDLIPVATKPDTAVSQLSTETHLKSEAQTDLISPDIAEQINLLRNQLWTGFGMIIVLLVIMIGVLLALGIHKIKETRRKKQNQETSVLGQPVIQAENPVDGERPRIPAIIPPIPLRNQPTAPLTEPQLLDRNTSPVQPGPTKKPENHEFPDSHKILNPIPNRNMMPQDVEERQPLLHQKERPIAQPVDNSIISIPGDHEFLNKHNLATFSVNFEPQPDSTEVKSVSNADETDKQDLQIPEDIQTTERPRSNTGHPDASSSVANPSYERIDTNVSNTRERGSRTSSGHDSGHYSSGSPSSTRSADLKASPQQQNEVVVEIATPDV